MPEGYFKNPDGTKVEMVDAEARRSASERYKKPPEGIPETDLSEKVKEKLNQHGSGGEVTKEAINNALGYTPADKDKVVQKETGKGLSTNDYSDIDKSKVNNLPTNVKEEIRKLDSRLFESITEISGAVFGGEITTNPDVRPSINLYNPNDEDLIDNAFIDVNGIQQANNTFLETGFIKCNKGDTFTFYYNNEYFTASTRIFVFYDSSKQFISGNQNLKMPTITIPINCEYFRTCIMHKETSNLMIVKNDTEIHEYEPWGTITSGGETTDYGNGLINDVKNLKIASEETINGLNGIKERIEELENGDDDTVTTTTELLNILYPTVSGNTASGYVSLEIGETEAGSISNGVNSDNTKLFRTKEYIDVSSIDSLKVESLNDAQCYIYFYDSNQTYKGSTGNLDNTNTPIDVPLTKISYIRIAWRYKSATGKYPDEGLFSDVSIKYWKESDSSAFKDRKNDIEKILSDYGECILAKGDFYVSGVSMPVGSKIRGFGSDTRIYLMSSVADGCCIETNGNNTIESIAFYQDGGFSDRPTSTTIGTKDGVRIQNESSLIRINNCDFYGFERAGIYGRDVGHADYSAIISGCRMHYNLIGIYFYNRFEYANISDCVSDFNYYGIINNSGNNLFANCHFDYNVYAWYTDEQGLPLTSNGGHGSAVGCTFNHCESFGVYWRAGSNGFVFNGCQFWYSPIYLRSTSWICFVGCQIGGATIPITFYGASKGHRFSNCSFGVMPTFNITDATTTTRICIVNDCWLWDGSEEVVFGS